MSETALTTASDCSPVPVQRGPWFRVLEQSCTGKEGPRTCEDLLVVSSTVAAVVDGATSKDDREWLLDGQPVRSGRWAATILGRLLRQVADDDDARTTVDRVVREFGAAVDAQHPDVPRGLRPAASFVLVHGPRRELWSLGDCAWSVGGRVTRPRKRVDELVAALRAAAHEALQRGADPTEATALCSEDPARGVVLPFLRLQGALAGSSSEFGFGHVDGLPVGPHLHVEPLLLGAEVVLASDGYPEVHADHGATEAALQAALAADRECVGPALRGTKAAAPGVRSFDDRAYLRLRLA